MLGVGSSLLVSDRRVSSKTSESGTGNSKGSTLFMHVLFRGCVAFPIVTSFWD